MGSESEQSATNRSRVLPCRLVVRGDALDRAKKGGGGAGRAGGPMDGRDTDHAPVQ